MAIERSKVVTLACLVAWAFAAQARAVTIVIVPIQPPAALLGITYAVTDLPDLEPGKDRFRYDYALDSYSYAAHTGFRVWFNPNLYESLELDPPDVGAEWETTTHQPDPALAVGYGDGFFDAQSLTAQPSLLAGFSVEFVWLGAGAPVSQPFDVYMPDASGPSVFSIATGHTVLVPEPASAALVALGLLGLALRRR